jgi:guanylate kinase
MGIDRHLPAHPPQLLVVVSGSSGVGKDAVINRIREMQLPFAYVVTATTRELREGEADGVPYHFVSLECFRKMIDDGEMLEWAKVYDNFYGVPLEAVRKSLSTGLDVMVKVDVQGAATLRKVVPEAVLIFIQPPSMEELERRLRSRSSETAEQLAVRLGKAEEEYSELPIFDYVVTSYPNRIDDVVAQIQAIVVAEKSKVHPRTVQIASK